MLVSAKEMLDKAKELDITNSIASCTLAIETGETVDIVISKGKLEMPKITNITDFTIWANENDVLFELNYDYSNTILKDEIIKYGKLLYEKNLRRCDFGLFAVGSRSSTERTPF